MLAVCLIFGSGRIVFSTLGPDGWLLDTGAAEPTG